MKDSEGRLRDGDVDDVFGADAEGGAGFRQNDELVSVNRTLVLDWVRLHLKEKSSLAEARPDCSRILPEVSLRDLHVRSEPSARHITFHLHSPLLDSGDFTFNFSKMKCENAEQVF